MPGEESSANAAAAAMEDREDTKEQQGDIALLTPFWRGVVLLLREGSMLLSTNMKVFVTLSLAMLAGATPLIIHYLDQPDQKEAQKRTHEIRKEELRMLSEAIRAMESQTKAVIELVAIDKAAPNAP